MKCFSNDNSGTDLSQLPSGSEFLIKRINACGEVRRRLVDIGFIKGERGRIIREALLRDPIEIEIKGTKVSLRRCEARLIKVDFAE